MPEEDVAGIRVDLARLEGKLDAALTGQAAQIRELRDDVEDHETRLRTEEQRPRVTPKHLYMGLSVAVLLLSGIGIVFSIVQ